VAEHETQQKMEEEERKCKEEEDPSALLMSKQRRNRSSVCKETKRPMREKRKRGLKRRRLRNDLHSALEAGFE